MMNKKRINENRELDGICRVLHCTFLVECLGTPWRYAVWEQSSLSSTHWVRQRSRETIQLRKKEWLSECLDSATWGLLQFTGFSDHLREASSPEPTLTALDLHVYRGWTTPGKVRSIAHKKDQHHSFLLFEYGFKTQIELCYNYNCVCNLSLPLPLHINYEPLGGTSCILIIFFHCLISSINIWWINK